MAKRSLKKRILNSWFAHVILSLLVSLAARFLFLSSRVHKTYPAASLPYFRGELPCIFCFWHGRMIMQPFVRPRNKKVFVLISHHNDGALITKTMRWLGVGAVRGSRKHGGAQALRDLLKVTQAGNNIVITPDGPRGPFQKAASGAAYVAAKTGYALIPITFSATRYRRFKSWDKFMLPMPFTRLLFVAGEPIFVSADSDEAMATATLLLEASLTRITAEADALCGIA